MVTLKLNVQIAIQMKHLLLLSFILILGCKSISNHTIKDFYSLEVKDELLSYTNKYKESDSYLTQEINEEEKIRIITLQSCGGCYIQELIDDSTESITLENVLEIKILKTSDIENYEVPTNKIVMYVTGGTYVIETDFKGRILRKVVND